MTVKNINIIFASSLMVLLLLIIIQLNQNPVDSNFSPIVLAGFALTGLLIASLSGAGLLKLMFKKHAFWTILIRTLTIATLLFYLQFHISY